MDEAPRGTSKPVTRTIGKNTVEQIVHFPVPIIAAGNDGVVTVSRWLEAEQRWNMFSKSCPPRAWQPWPAHPGVSE